MTIEQIVGGVIWIQSMILLAALVFAVFEAAFMLCGQRRCFLTRRRLGVSACLSLAVLPFVLPLLMSSPLATSVNATDAIVAQYLKGNLSVSASEMSSLISMKTQFVDHIATGGSWPVMVLVAAFLTALIARSVYLLVNVSRISRAIQAGHVMRQSRRVRVVVSPEITVPFSTRGLWFYYVVLPENLYRDRDAMQMSIGHEMQHIRQGDVDAEVVLSLISPLVVLNPGFWFLSGRLRKLGELACDRAYLARRRFDAHGYSIRLLTIARRNRNTRGQPRAFGVPLVGRSVPLIGRRSMLKDRILEIAHDQSNPTRERRFIGVAMSVVMSACVLLGATSLAQPAGWSHERIMLSTVANLERLNQLNTLAQRSW
ncbi:M56 family metallopeptidase [Aliiroseovarius sp. 2305UL8-7]|uniref:M56 family metallopeptidase n=1 Tax=Aliiroseovarius conchicola TaxID=3121637 RepID=UPI003529A7A6